MKTRSTSRRRHYLVGAATAGLATALAMPAAAQSTDTRAAGGTVVVTDQTRRTTPTLADASHVDTHIVLSAPLTDSAARIDTIVISASARGNRAAASIAHDPGLIDQADRPTMLQAGTLGMDAEAETLLAINQRNISAPVRAEAINSQFALNASSVAGGQLSLADNVLETSGLGNDTTAAMDSATSGAGIVALQRNDQASSVVARTLGGFRLAADSVSASTLTLGGNRAGAAATGNSVETGMTVTSNAIEVRPSTAIASSVPSPGEGDPSLSAAYSVLAHQIVGGDVGAEAGRLPLGVVILGPANGSHVSADTNNLLASGTGNRSANALRIQAGSIFRDAGSESPVRGPVAALANVQRAERTGVSASTGGGAIANILGGLSTSSYSVSQNLTRSMATGNLAERNQLDISAGTIDMGGSSGSSPVGTAQTGIEGDVTASAAFTVQNVQDRGTGTIAAASNLGVATLQASGTVDHSSLRADRNSQLLSATGNEATNALSLHATALRATADLNNVQTGDGDVRSIAGLLEDPAGVILSPTGTLLDSSFSVSGNETVSAAVANTGTNSFAVEAGTIANGSGHEDAVAGPLPFGYGAAADFALASHQKVGQPTAPEGGSLTRIDSAVTGRFAISGDRSAERSNFHVDDNSQAASALGNSVVNRFSLSAQTNGGHGAPSAGSALSSAQYGQADVDALSRVRLAVRGSAVDSRMSMSGNVNRAFAAMNDADNRMVLDMGMVGDLTRTDTRVAISTTSGIAGDHVLGNLQYANGSVRARAATWLLSGDYGQGLNGSQLAVEDNESSAEASANRAINQLDMSLTSGAPTTGIGSMQMSTAKVEAVAGTKVGYAPVAAGSVMKDAVLTASGNLTDALARGNVADNRLTLTGLTADPAFSAPRVEVDSLGMKTRAPAALLNFQTNHGGVTATAEAVYDAPLNAGVASVSDTALRLEGNRVTAAAYGNAASNTIAMPDAIRPTGAAVSNVQVNTGPVTALATASRFAIDAGPIVRSSLAITGNQVVATATGNQATSIISPLR